jgi:TRAP-type C4-dicarboxylate transport system permease small subunit
MAATADSMAVVASHRVHSGRAIGALAVVEDLAVAAALAGAVLVPLAEIVLRASLRVGIEGAGAIVQHLTLAIGMLGAAIAAREERLLTLAVSGFITGPAAGIARFASGITGAAVACLLALAAVDFMATERAAGTTFVYGLPVWVAQLPLPIGFGLIAIRLAWCAMPTARGRVVAAGLAVIAVAWLRLAPFDPSTVVIPALIVLAAATALGAPLFVAIGGGALFLL